MARPLYLFRNFTLDPAARELRRDGELLALPISALDCLVHLVENRHRAVGRDELIATVWARVDVADALLAQTILKIRRTLEDKAHDGAIRTIARFGYRWVEETQVEETPESGSSPNAQPEDLHAPNPYPDQPDNRPCIAPSKNAAESEESQAPLRAPSVPIKIRFVRGKLIAVLTLGLAVLALLMANLQNRKPSAGNDASHLPSSADAALVLPSGFPASGEWSWLRLGLMDLIGNRLRQSGLPTLPAESVLALLGEGSDDADATALAPAIRDAWKISPDADFSDGLWRVHLVAEKSGATVLRSEASQSDVLEAARQAADLLAIQLGYTPRTQADSRPMALEELLQRTKAAILSDQFDLAMQLINQAPPSVRSSPEVELRLAQIDMARGDNQAAQIRLMGLLDQLAADSDAVLRGRTLLTLGAVQFRQNQLKQALQTHEEAIALLEPADDPAGLAGALAGRAAITAKDDNQLLQAAADLGRASVEMAAAGDVLGLAQVDMNLALIKNRQYRPDQALAILRDVENRISSLGAREELAYVRFHLVGILIQLTDLQGARQSMNQLLPLHLHTGNDWLQQHLMLEQAHLDMSSGKLSGAGKLIETLLARDDAEEGVKTLARGMQLRLAVMQGQCDEAVSLAPSTLTPMLEATQADAYLLAWTAHIECERTLGNISQARHATDALRGWTRLHPNDWRETRMLVAEASQLKAEGQNERALAAYAEAFGRASEVSIPDTTLAVAMPYAIALIENGDIDQAAAVVGSVARWADQDWRAAWIEKELYRAQGRTTAWEAASARALSLAGERVPPPISVH